jgi:SAM-dependent methyltransferase
MVSHLLAYSMEAIDTQGLTHGDFVVEFGSNDGCLLRHFQAAGMRVLGVDPARNLAELACSRGIPTIAEFFNEEIANRIRAEHGQPMLVCANHCCAHIDDLASVIRGVRALLHADGLFVMEVGYLLSVYSGNLFDTIYHEHCDFHRVGPLCEFFERHGLRIMDCKVVDIQGGSLR